MGAEDQTEMKIAVISDLHLDVNREYPVLEILAEYAARERADTVIVAGDVTECARETVRAMQTLEEMSGCRVFYVPGNHDMWSEDFAKLPTETLYRVFEEDPRCLTGKPRLLEGKDGRFVLFGDIGWYDYSFADPSFPAAELDRMTYAGRTWQDRLKNQWTADNRGQTALQMARLEEQLRSYEGIPAVVVTHMIPVKEFCVDAKAPGREMWGYFNAFLGAGAFGELFERYEVRVSISGHVHFRTEVCREREEDRAPQARCGRDVGRTAGVSRGRPGRTRYLCPCLGYHTEWKWFCEAHAKDAEWQIRDAVRWVEL